jgi:hypothetical protein
VPHGNWQARRRQYSLTFRSVSLSLDVDKPNPGLETGQFGGDAWLLALDGSSRAGRSDPFAFGPELLVGWDLIRIVIPTSSSTSFALPAH